MSLPLPLFAGPAEPESDSRVAGSSVGVESRRHAAATAGATAGASAVLGCGVLCAGLGHTRVCSARLGHHRVVRRRFVSPRGKLVHARRHRQRARREAGPKHAALRGRAPHGWRARSVSARTREHPVRFCGPLPYLRRHEPGRIRKLLERETGFEPATSTLARSHSTTELFPLRVPD